MSDSAALQAPGVGLLFPAGIDGSPGDDVLTGANGADSIDGHAGDDTISGGGGDDLVLGGLGDDVLGGGSGADTLFGGPGSDLLSGGSGDDVLNGGGGGDTLDGGSGNDSLSGGGGANALSGGDGDDTLDGGPGDATLDGGAGFDTASFADAAQGVQLDIYNAPDLPDVAFIGKTHQDLTNVEAVVGSQFADQLTSFEDHGHNLLDGAGGDDTLEGGGGDTVLGGDGADFLGIDTSRRGNGFGHGSSVLDGGVGHDTLSGGYRANDLLQGGDDADTLYWSGSKAGADTLDGGAGNDTAIIASFSAVTADLETGTASAGGGANVATLINIENLTGSHNYNSDHLSGDDQANILTGTGGADVLTGRGGADVFAYQSIYDSSPIYGEDLITDLANEDSIDLSKIDADQTTGGDDAFHLVSAFTHHAGELVVAYDAKHDLTTISGDVDGDGVAELVITAAGDHHDFTNFVL